MVTVTTSFSVMVPEKVTLPTAKISRLAAFRTPEYGTLLSAGVYTITGPLKAAVTDRFVPSQGSDRGGRMESVVVGARVVPPPSAPVITSGRPAVHVRTR